MSSDIDNHGVAWWDDTPAAVEYFIDRRTAERRKEQDRQLEKAKDRANVS